MLLERKTACSGSTYWQNPKTGIEYRKVVMGFSWPGKKPGYIIVFSEDRYRDARSDNYSINVVTEFEQHGMDVFVEKLHEVAGLYCVTDLYGDPDDKVGRDFLYSFNDKLSRRGRQGIYISRPPMIGERQCFEYGVQTILKLLRAGKKVLFLGEHSRLPSYLLELQPQDVGKADPGNYPAVAALGYAVTALTCWPAREGQDQAPQRAITDYDVFNDDKENQNRRRF